MTGTAERLRDLAQTFGDREDRHEHQADDYAIVARRGRMVDARLAVAWGIARADVLALADEIEREPTTDGETERFVTLLRQRLARWHDRADRVAGRLEGLSPLAVLGRGGHRADRR